MLMPPVVFFPDNLDPGEYLVNVFRLQAAMTEEEEYLTSLLGITELLKYGTTCFLDPGSTKYLDACMQAYQDAGCRIVVGSQVADLPNPLNLPVYPLTDAVSLMEKSVRTYNGRLDGRVRAWPMPFSAEYCTRELLLAAKEIADRNGTGITWHQVNNQAAVDACLHQHGMRPVEYLEDIGVLGPNLLLSHVVGLNQAEVDCLARSGTKAVMCPSAALRMGAGITPHGMLAGDAGPGRLCRLGDGCGQQLQFGRDHACHVSDRCAV